MKRTALLVVVFLVALFGFSVADEIVLQQGLNEYMGCADATIGKPQGYNQNSNYGSTNDLSIEYCPG